jgi:hypothetical protein
MTTHLVRRERGFRGSAAAKSAASCRRPWHGVIWMTVEELMPVADDDHRTGSFTDRARSLLSSVGQDDRVKQAASVTKEVAAQAQEASKNVTRKISQEDAWDELRGDVEELTEIARAHHALIIDLIDRVGALEARARTEPPAGHDG